MRSRIAEIAEVEYQAQNFKAVADALNAPRHDVTDNAPGGYKKAAAVLTDVELEQFLAVLEKFSRSQDDKVGIIAHVLRQFSLDVLDFSSAAAQKLFSMLADVGVSPDVADRLMRVGVRTESDADQLNGGVPYTAEDVQALWDAEQADRVRSTLANYLATKVQAVQDAIESGEIVDEAGVDAALVGGK